MWVPPGSEGPTRPVIPRPKIVKKPSINFIDFEFQKKTEFPASYISLVSLKNRGNVLKIKSELDTEAGRLPQYYVHAVVDSESLQDVLGNEIGAQMFVQTSADGGVWSHTDPVKITVEQKDAYYNVSMRGRLKNTKTGKVEFTSANFACLDMSKP